MSGWLHLKKHKNIWNDQAQGKVFLSEKIKILSRRMSICLLLEINQSKQKNPQICFSFLKNLKAKFKGYCYNNKDLDISHSSDSSAGYWVYMFQVLIPLWLNIYSMARLPCFSSIYCPGPGFTKFERDKIIFFNWKLFLLYIFTSKCLIFSIL